MVAMILIINETSSNAVCAEGKVLNDPACLPQVVGERPSNHRRGKSSGQTLPHMVRATRPEANERARMANVSAHCVLRSVLSCGFTMSRHCLRSVFLREIALVALVVGFIISGIRFNIGLLPLRLVFLFCFFLCRFLLLRCFSLLCFSFFLCFLRQPSFAAHGGRICSFLFVCRVLASPCITSASCSSMCSSS